MKVRAWLVSFSLQPLMEQGRIHTGDVRVGTDSISFGALWCLVGVGTLDK